MTFTQFSSALKIIRTVFAIIQPLLKPAFSSDRIVAKWPYFGEWSTSHLLFDSWVKILTRFQKSIEKYSTINYLAWEETWGNSGLYFFHKFGYCGWWPYQCEPPIFLLSIIIFSKKLFWRRFFEVSRCLQPDRMYISRNSSWKFESNLFKITFLLSSKLSSFTVFKVRITINYSVE